MQPQWRAFQTDFDLISNIFAQNHWNNTQQTELWWQYGLLKVYM
jgi:hypothetical protein